MKIDLTLLPVDSHLSGFELGDFTLSHEGIEITSAGHEPSQSMMIFIFLADLLDLVFDMKKDSRENNYSITATDSSFTLSLKKIGNQIYIENKKTALILPLEKFVQALYSNIRDWLNPLKPRIDPTDSALVDLLHALHKYQAALLPQ
jgi:hypothetical protein